ncbi:MAG: hypothetical protein AAB553_00330 [Patescibacteria group bacterium]
MKKYFLIAVLFLLIAGVINSIIFTNIGPNKFIYIGDQFFRFSYFEAFINSFFIRKLENLSVLNGWQFTTQFWDAVYYLFVYTLHISFITAEKMLFFLTLALSLLLSFIGFVKIQSLVSKEKKIVLLFVITLWYCFNPYIVMLWHGGVYNLGSALTYSLAPLILYYYHRAVFTDSPFRQKVICAILMAVASYTFWLFAPFVFLLILYSLLYLIFSLRAFPRFLKNICMLLMLYLPLVSWLLFNILYEYTNNVGDNNATFMPTFGNEQGGFLYQLLMLFSWGIYTVWTPRSMYPFHAYYFSNTYIWATLAVYILIALGVISHYFWIIVRFLLKRKKKLVVLPNAITKFLKKKSQLAEYSLSSKLLIIFSLLLFISIFLAKAAQPPFGEIFLYLYNNVPFFSVFRTADIRFGFCVVLSISLLFLLISREFNKYVLAFVIIVIIGLQSPFFFTGKAIQGENIKKLFYDRVIYYPTEQREVVDFINKDKSLATYVLTLPAIEYGDYSFDSGERHFGQDILPKLIKKSFVYLSQSNGISVKGYKELQRVIEKKDYEGLKKFPIKYLILRQDISCIGCPNLSEAEIGKNLPLVYKNKRFAVYEIQKHQTLIDGENITFSMVNPVKYRVHFDNLKKEQTLQLLTSFNKDWKVYLQRKKERSCNAKVNYSEKKTECLEEVALFEGEELAYLWEKPLFESSHQLSSGYANKWEIDPQFIKRNYSSDYYTLNKDGSMSVDMLVYYQPQSWFYLFLLVSSLSLFMGLIYMFRYK